jgi:hypothetical protein
MKRIIDGVTFNTDTATEVAEGVWEDQDRGIVATTTLYQNRAGVFFSVEEIEQTFRHPSDGEWRSRKSYDWTKVGSAPDAIEFCQKVNLTITREIDDLPPEAEPGDAAATVYIRMPPALKASIETKAKAAGVSVNVFALRCLEGCVDATLAVTHLENAASSVSGLENAASAAETFKRRF